MTQDNSSAQLVDADGLDAIEALVLDAAAIEGVANVHEGSSYYAERLIRRAVEQGTLKVIGPENHPARVPVSQDAAQLVERLRTIEVAFEEYQWFLAHNPNAEPSEFLPALRQCMETVLPDADSVHEAADLIEALTRVQPSTGLDAGEELR